MERLGDAIRSTKNKFFWRLREKIRFRRDGYRESGGQGRALTAEAESLATHYGLNSLRAALSPATFEKNLATVWILERMVDQVSFSPGLLKVLEPGCQDFARLPAVRAYLRRREITPQIIGVEVDAYPLLQGFHSRADKARYYLSLEGNHPQDRYAAQDFFAWNDPAPFVLCFYPFVSPHPALAWGLPKEFGQAEKWVDAFERNLAPGGTLLVVHQGEWEEEAFDEARKDSPLKLWHRMRVDCPFYPLPHPACASVYTLGANL